MFVYAAFYITAKADADVSNNEIENVHLDQAIMHFPLLLFWVGCNKRNKVNICLNGKYYNFCT